MHRCILPPAIDSSRPDVMVVAVAPEKAHVQHPFKKAAKDPAAILWSIRVRMTRAPLQTNLSVALVGDSQTEVAAFQQLLGTIQQLFGPGGCWLTHLGDLVLHGSSQHEWDVSVAAPLSDLSYPLLALRGNHDVDEDNGAMFDSNVGHGGWRRFFAFTAARVRFLALDSSYEDPEQLAWLETELRETQRVKRRACDNGNDSESAPVFVVILMHIGPFVEYWDPTLWRSPQLNEEAWADFVKRDFVPLFEAFGVDLVASGHSHTYLRGFRRGVAYLTLGGGGAGLENGEANRVASWLDSGETRAVHFTTHFGILSHVMLPETDSDPNLCRRGGALRFEAFHAATGERLDELLLRPKVAIGPLV